MDSDTDVVIRPTTGADAPLLRSIYQGLSSRDLRRRFLSPFEPDEHWCHEWASIGEHDGYGAIAVTIGDDGAETPLGEAGYSVRDDGDADLGIVVVDGAPSSIGRDLLDDVVRHAGACGIPNIQSEILSDDRAMRALLSNRGTVTLDRGGPTTRSSFATDGSVASWPDDDDRPHVLVEVSSGRWAGERDLAARGLAVAVCRGPEHREGGCPEIEGGGCPLVDGADAIVVLLDPEHPDTDRLVDAHRSSTPSTPIFLRSTASPAEIEQLAQLDTVDETDD